MHDTTITDTQLGQFLGIARAAGVTPERFHSLLTSGVLHDVLLLDLSTEEARRAISGRLLEGKEVLQRRRLCRLTVAAKLTRRETETAQLIALGATAVDAAARMGVSLKTYDNHVNSLRRKIARFCGANGSVTRAHVIHYAIAADLVPLQFLDGRWDPPTPVAL